MSQRQAVQESRRLFNQDQAQGSTPNPATAVTSPSHDDIARRAFMIYTKSGNKEGQSQQNWDQAEREMKQDAESKNQSREMQNEGGPPSQSQQISHEDSPITHNGKPNGSNSKP